MRFSLSGDGNRVAYAVGTPTDIWVISVASGIATRVSFSGGDWPRWSPDGKQQRDRCFPGWQEPAFRAQ